jgi:thiol-disulfide isomerase/thioredoxin
MRFPVKPLLATAGLLAACVGAIVTSPAPAAQANAPAPVTPAPAAAHLHDLGAAPEFTGIAQWFNSAPLTLQQLRGKVVLVDFWTYSCINCLHTLPHVRQWNAAYKAQGLAVIGVHTPELPFERLDSNLQGAIKRLGITFPVAQDNRYATWGAYRNQYWPAFYLIDKKGRIAYEHFGEDNYAETEAAIRTLLAQPD